MSQAEGPRDERAALQQHEALVARLMRPGAYPAPVERVQRIDTHVSTVLLAGGYAYKLRKPVSLGFLDFSTLEARRRDCEEELRLNRRTAPDLYLDIVAVIGPQDSPRFGDSAPDAPIIDVAVRMRRFDPQLTLDHVAERGELTPELVDRVAAAAAALHARSAMAPAGSGAPERVARWMHDNFSDMRDQVQSPEDRSRLDALSEWTRSELAAKRDQLVERVLRSRIRECHGDLHLGNVALIDGDPTLFDAIEFNADLRRIDVISDVAFTFIDLMDRSLPGLAWRYISTYLEMTGDYEGLALLRLYAVYRALVRAKVALIRLRQPAVKSQVRVRDHASFEHYLALAERLRNSTAAALVLMTGLSGSGKSTVAQTLAETLGGVRIRSDVERKRLFGLEPAADSHGGIYSEDATRRVYDRLAALAGTVLRAGFPVVIDAASLKRSERARFVALAATMHAHAAIVVCTAPMEVLRGRLRSRALSGTDASEATEDVLDSQLGWQEPLDAAEQRLAVVIDTSGDLTSVERSAAEIAAALRGKTLGRS
jgi:aminoglycoside phosphotransferase family enzyme/predicted kinase